MKLYLAALIVVSVIALAATVAATWASVADAPWEDEVAIPTQADPLRVAQCEAALSLQSELLLINWRDLRITFDNYNQRVADTERDVSRYC